MQISAVQGNPFIVTAVNLKFPGHVQKILRCFKLHLYKIQLVQALAPDNGPYWKELDMDMLGVKMEAARSFKTLVSYHIPTWCYNPEDHHSFYD